MTGTKIALCAALLAMSACAAPEVAAPAIDASTRQPATLAASPPVARFAPQARRADRVAQVFVGLASWYGAMFQGRPTASGEPFDMHGLTAAHRTLPFGTRVRVVNEETGQSVVVRVNDRGPFAGKRIIDLSRAAAERIGLRHEGVGRVKVEVLGRA